MESLNVRGLVVFLTTVLTVAAHAQERPLPDVNAFLKEVRQRLQTDEQRQRDYVYQETRRERKVDRHGRLTQETVKVYESYPGLPGEPRWERLISIDGRPVSAADLEKQDRERHKKVQAYQRKRERETDRDRQAQVREREQKQRENDLVMDDAFRVSEIRMLGRETIGRHETIAFSMTPRRDAKPRTREGRIIRHFAGKAWVSESDYEVVRLEVEAIDAVSFGLGLVRLHEGSRLTFERRKVNDETWLPARASYTLSARVALLKRLRFDAISEFSNYRRFQVDTETAIALPRP